MVGSCIFLRRSLDHERFTYWLKRNPSDKHKAVCKLCNSKNVSLLKMGVFGIISHMNGKNHQRTKAKNVTSLLQPLYFKPKEQMKLIRRAVLIQHRMLQRMQLLSQRNRQWFLSISQSIKCGNTLGAENRYDARIFQVFSKIE